MKLALFLFVLSSSLSANSNFHPLSNFFIDREEYCLSYDGRNKNPTWVYECLTCDKLCGKSVRDSCQFKEDSSLPKILRATLSDYKNSGFDRGHLAPAANHKESDIAMADTFFLSNMCPQCPKLNRGCWAKLEKYTRDLTKEYSKVHVVSGPLYLPYTDTDGKRYVKYQVIGSNDVAVPTHFFKVILLENTRGAIKTEAYILPNDNSLQNEASLDQFKTTVQKVEKLAGILFSSK